MQKGRFLDTESVLDVPELLSDPTLDLVIVRSHDSPPEIGSSDDPRQLLYSYDPNMTNVDQAVSRYVEDHFPGIAVVGGGLFYDISVDQHSMNHYDQGSENWSFTGPIACSWATEGTAKFRAQRDPVTFLRPDRKGQYSVKPFSVFGGLALKTFTTKRRELRTEVVQREGDRVFFANLPWATYHGVSLVTPRRLAHTFDNLLYVPGNAKQEAKLKAMEINDRVKVAPSLL